VDFARGDSLPVPVSPSISTCTSQAAKRCNCARTATIAWDWPIMIGIISSRSRPQENPAAP